MTVLYGATKTQVYKLLDEVSSSTGAVESSPDVLTKILEYCNDAITDLSSTFAKIPAVMPIPHNPVNNALSYDTSATKNHLPGVDDYPVTQTGALSYFVEVSGHYNIVIEESIAGVWTTLVTLTPTVGSEPTTFTELKGLLTPSSALNSVRMRLTGNYIYPYRNYVLYPYSFPSAALVQQCRPHFLYALPADFLKLKDVMIRRDVRQWIPYTNYLLTNDKQIGINRYDTGEFMLNYYRKPTLLVYTGVDLTDDAQAIDLTDDAARLIPYYAAGQILGTSSDPTEVPKGTKLLNQYEIKKGNIVATDISYSGQIVNVYNW